MHRVARITWIVILGMLIAIGICAGEPSKTLSFDEGWRFRLGDVPGGELVSLGDASWQSVSLPHTWNTESDPPPRNYCRGPGWYRKSFVAEEAWNGERVFVRFGAASLVAKVFLNGQDLGEHKGGFAAFCFELTPHLLPGQTNVLAVRVDNARREDVIPLAGDFTIYGGLYRSAALIIKPSVCISPLDHGSSGIYVKQENLSDEAGDILVETLVSNSEAAPREIVVKAAVLDAAGVVVASGSSTAVVSARAGQTIARKLSVPRPRLWNGVADPYLYSVRVEVLAGGATVDAVEQPLGLRTIGFEPGRGFVLNGKVQPIRGVNRHQDWAHTGWATVPAQIEKDIRLICEMGATGVRLAHYQHDDLVYSLCDRAGLVVWAELPLVNDLRGSVDFRDNARQQLTELIRQNYNHPSIALWSLFNEISPKNTNDPVPFVRELHQLAKQLDAGRPTVGAFSIDGAEKLPNLGEVTDVFALNVYPGWYFGTPGDMGREIDKWSSRHGSRAFIISEYGAGASVRQHQFDFAGRAGRAPADWHPEEWQSLVHEGNYSAIRGNSNLVGSFVWNMFDFASAARHEGDTAALNDKGLVTRDRSTKKDAYYFYQANWATQPMIRIAGQRQVVLSQREIVVKAYSNLEHVRLRVNGVECGEMPETGQHVFASHIISLDEGANRIEAEGGEGGARVRDSWECRYVPAPEPAAVRAVMERVADWQLANPSKYPTTDWIQAAGYTGLMALADISDNPKYLDAMLAMGASNRWALGPRTYFADDHCVGQTYCELFLRRHEPRMIEPMRRQFDEILAKPRYFPTLDFKQRGITDLWSWCDSLFMAPPTWVLLWKCTGDERYLDFAITNWWRTSEFLYDQSEHLYYRDSTFFNRREPNGQKVFWSRGNGWVLAGLARIVEQLPAAHPARKTFERQFKEMANQALVCQQPDGLWRASLLDPGSYPAKESSGSAFYVYAFAWGINKGLLERGRFEPAMLNGWSALVECVDADGKLGRVQPPGSAPRQFAANSSEAFGVGAFLLAGREIYRFADGGLASGQRAAGR